MPKNITDTFTASEAALLAEMNIETLRVWRRREHFTLSGEKAGWTRFDFVDVMKIATFRTLVASFITHEAAEIITANCPEQYAKILGGTVDTAPPYLIFARGPDGEGLFEIVDGIEAAATRFCALGVKGPVYPTKIIVDFASILYRVMQRFAELNKE